MKEDVLAPEQYHPIEWHVEKCGYSERKLRDGIAKLKAEDAELFSQIMFKQTKAGTRSYKLYYREDLVKILDERRGIHHRYEFKEVKNDRPAVKEKIQKTKDKYRDYLHNPEIPVENVHDLSMEQRMMLVSKICEDFQKGNTDLKDLIYRYMNCNTAQFFRILHKEPVLLNMWADGIRDAKIAWATTVEQDVFNCIMDKLNKRTKKTEVIRYEWKTKVEGEHIRRVMIEKDRTETIEEISPDIPTLIMAQRMVDNIKESSLAIGPGQTLTGISKMPSKEELAEMEKNLIEEYLRKTSPDNKPPM